MIGVFHRPPRAAGWRLFLLAMTVALGACRQVPTGTSAPAVEAAPPPVRLEAGVVAANPMAVDAGVEVLRAGGSAADAAVAVQAVLGLVEPQSSGLGGGAFMLYYDAASGRTTAFNGREAAPAGATANMFLDEHGAPLSYTDAVTSGRSTGVPGAVVMLGLAQQRHGKLAWARLFDPAIRLAERGFVVPRRLGRFANSSFPQAQLPDARAIFRKPDGATVQPGDTLTNRAYAETLRTVAAQGPRALLEGPLAQQIVARTHEPPRPGTLTLHDLAAYQPLATDPLCRPFRVYVVCVPPPPSSGVALLQLLALLERTDIIRRDARDPQAWFEFAEASRIMYADRDQYVADPALVNVPVDGLLDPGYIASRAAQIGDHASADAPSPGSPPGASVSHLGKDATHEAMGTSHFVIVDAAGNVASMTTSVESLFGSGRAVGGFFLNKKLKDFSFTSVDDSGHAVANAVAGGKRPRSSMTPVIVFRRGSHDVVAALGSPGGSAILAYNGKALLGLLGWNLPLQEAVDLPNLIAKGTDAYGEVAKFQPATLEGLAARGVTVKPGRGEESGLHGIAVRGDPPRFEAAADPRREGVWKAVSAGP
jgi:gamma-glutamyltranspeptidase/glutathione hydrolase